jgi:hypothetical protein
MEGVVHADSCFWETFVPHADGFLNSNINDHLGLANGTPIKYHSMTFSSEHVLQLVCKRMRKKPLGLVIILDGPPLAVNISLPKTFATKKQLSTKRKAQHKIFKDLSLCDHDILTPIRKWPSLCKWKTFTMKKGNMIDVATVTARQHFPIELAFSMTVHKAQGQTIPRVVLALCQHPRSICKMEYASIFVAMSRIQHRDHMRLIYHDSGKLPGEQGFTYILLPSSLIQMLLSTTVASRALLESGTLS